DVGRLRRQDAARSNAARARPVLGSDEPGRPVVLQGARRLAAACPLDMSLNDLAHSYATDVLAALADAAVDAFLVGRHGDALTFGVALTDRAAALEALAGRLEGCWYIKWEDGSRVGTSSLRDAAGSRHA